MPGPALRRMIHADIPLGMRLKALANWNQTLDDWELLLNAGTGWVAEYRGVDVGTATVIPYGQSFSWIGMVLVDPAYRRRGIGTALLQRAIEAAATYGIPRLDATPEGEQLYVRCGFRAECRVDRLVRSTSPVRVPAPASGAGDLCAMSEEQLADVLRFDAAIFGADREPVLRSLLQRAPERAFCWLEGRILRGYCLGRPGSRSDQIGPVVADSARIACSLIAAALAARPDRSVVADVPAGDATWRAWLAGNGFSLQRSFTRMFLGEEAPPGEVRKQFAIAGPELG